MLLEREAYLAQLESFRASAAVVIRDGAARVMIVRPTYKPGWELPGGSVDPGESPRLAAEREVAEELGIRLAVATARVAYQIADTDVGRRKVRPLSRPRYR